MIAIFTINRVFYGFKEDVSLEEAETFQLDYFLADELPEELGSIPDKHYAEVTQVDGELVVVIRALPEPEPEPKTPEQVRIEQLENDNLTLMEAVADLYEMILLGGDV